MLSPSTDRSRWSRGALLVALLMVLGGFQPALAQDAGQAQDGQANAPQEQEKKEPEGAEGEKAAEGEESAEEEPAGFTETIDVTGYRQAIEESVSLKRDAVNARDSIVTEDIGKMPDLNLAEAIQRVPGVAIVREGGEGRQLSLRGLGAEFTQVTLNGMEVPASTGGLDSSGAINRGRAFDFNVFPAELFSRIDINKSMVASVEEGGVGGAVQMYTAGGLDSPTMGASVQAQTGYNDLSGESDPRFTATYTAANKARTVGLMISAAGMERNSWQDGFGTVRWQRPDANFGGTRRR